MPPKAKARPSGTKDSSATTGFEAKMQAVSETKDNFSKYDDLLWAFGVPPKGNATFAEFRHLNNGLSGTVLRKVYRKYLCRAD
jgi:hypothetical protein